MSATTDNSSVPNTHDKDLVQLAGYHAYKYYDVGHVEIVNGKYYEVIDAEYDTLTGLDAMALKNMETQEVSVVYVGSDQLTGDWLKTNTQLPSYVEPAQMIAAKEYFKDVTDRFGEVTSVTGNSLAGANANAVGIENPNVKVVTLNPAMLPGGLIDSTKEYSNITNYYSKYDMLTTSQDSLRYSDRIPGNVFAINNGVSKFSEIIGNHKGYPEAKVDGEFKIEIGKKGESGHGYIYVGADDHIVTSIWTGAPLYGGQATQIQINEESLHQLAEGIKSEVKGRMGIAAGYVENSISIVQDESAKFNRRITQLQEMFQMLFEDLAGDPIFKGITTTGYIIKSYIDRLIELLNTAEEKCRFLNSILNSRPAELIEHITSTDISIESIFAPAKAFLTNLRYDVNELAAGAQNIIRNEIPETFKSKKHDFVDAIVGELDAHYRIIQDNKVKVDSQLTDYGEKIRTIAEIFTSVDQNSAGYLDKKSNSIEILKSSQQEVRVSLKDSPYLVNRMKIKELHLDIVHAILKKKSTVVLMPILVVIRSTLRAIEGLLESAILAIKAATNIAIYGNPVSLLWGIFSDYDERVRAAAKEARQPIEEMEAVIEGFRIAMDRLMMGLPDMLSNFRSYIDTAIFMPSKYSNIRLYNIASSSIFDEMDLLFNDITHQLGREKGKAIDAVLEISESVLENIRILKEQIDRGTI